MKEGILIKREGERECLTALAAMPGTGPGTLRALFEKCGKAATIWYEGERDERLTEKFRRALVSWRTQYSFERTKENLKKYEAVVLTWNDESYPNLLRCTVNPPPVLYCCGRLLQTEKTVALVGSRKADTYGLRAAHRLARTLAEAGVTVISGGARGIDTQAHLGTLAGGGMTWVITGAGLDKTYPPENAALFRRIIGAGGVVCSEFSFGTPPLGRNFPARNRVIAGLSRAVVVVEAAVRSGSLITADFALEEGRDVFAVPGSVYAPLCAGTNRLIKSGAVPLLSGKELLETYGWQEEVKKRERKALPPLSQGAGRIYKLMQGDRSVSYEELCAETALSPACLASALTELEMAGLIDVSAQQYFLKID